MTAASPKFHVPVRGGMNQWSEPAQAALLNRALSRLTGYECTAGSLFALEVLHRTGMQFYEVATFAVACGTICLTVFRGLTRAPFGQVWAFPEGLPVVDFRHVLFGEHHCRLPVGSLGCANGPLLAPCLDPSSACISLWISHYACDTGDVGAFKS